MLWAHNDSGGGAELFAVGLDGADRGRVEVVGAGAVDWEDIALLAGADGAPDRLLVADIGNNPGSGSRSSRPVRLHLIDEPVAPGPGSTDSTGPVTSVDLAYADGPRDAEALLADPLTGDVLVVSKQWDGAGAGVYAVPAATFSAAAPAPVTMARVATVGATEGSLVTGGDISADGRGRRAAHLQRRDRVGARPGGHGGRDAERRADLHRDGDRAPGRGRGRAGRRVGSGHRLRG